MKIKVGSFCLVIELRTRCTHGLVGICPRCWPDEARTRRNRKLALALAWLERIAAHDPHVSTLAQAKAMANSAIQNIQDLT